MKGLIHFDVVLLLYFAAIFRSMYSTKGKSLLYKSAIQDISYYSYTEYHPCGFLILTIRK